MTSIVLGTIEKNLTIRATNRMHLEWSAACEPMKAHLHRCLGPGNHFDLINQLHALCTGPEVVKYYVRLETKAFLEQVEDLQRRTGILEEIVSNAGT